MKACKIILNILGILLAIVFSALTICTLLITPIISMGTSLMQPSTLQSLIKEINFTDFLESKAKELTSNDSSKLNPELINKIINSELTQDVIDIYINNLLGIFSDDDINTLTKTQCHELINEHMPQLLSEIEPYLPEDFPISEENLETYVMVATEPLIFKAFSSLPTLEDLGIDPPVIKTLRNLHNGTYRLRAICLFSLFSFMILLCRYPKMKGFLWLGVIYLLSGVLILVPALNVHTLMDIFLPKQTQNLPASILNTLFTLFTNELFLWSCISCVLGILFIFIYVIIQKMISLASTKKFA